MNQVPNFNRWLYEITSTSPMPDTYPYDTICKNTVTGTYYIHTTSGWADWTGEWNHSPAISISTDVGITIDLTDLLVVNTSIKDAVDLVLTETSGILAESSAINANTDGLLTLTSGVLTQTSGINTNTDGILTQTSGINTNLNSLITITSGIEVNTAATVTALNSLSISASPILCLTADSTAANQAVTITVAAATSQKHQIYGYEIIVGGAALSANSTILVKDGSSSIIKSLLGVGSPVGENKAGMFDPPIDITTESDLVLTASAGGASVVLTGNLFYLTTT